MSTETDELVSILTRANAELSGRAIAAEARIAELTADLRTMAETATSAMAGYKAAEAEAVKLRLDWNGLNAVFVQMKDETNKLRAERDEAVEVVRRYRTETPLGHQPHMIAHVADEILAKHATGEKNG
jgi:chromosome segregation ATPase